MATKKINAPKPVAILEPEVETAIGVEPDNIEVFGARVHNYNRANQTYKFFQTKRTNSPFRTSWQFVVEG